MKSYKCDKHTNVNNPHMSPMRPPLMTQPGVPCNYEHLRARGVHVCARPCPWQRDARGSWANVGRPGCHGHVSTKQLASNSFLYLLSISVPSSSFFPRFVCFPQTLTLSHLIFFWIFFFWKEEGGGCVRSSFFNSNWPPCHTFPSFSQHYEATLIYLFILYFSSWSLTNTNEEAGCFSFLRVIVWGIASRGRTAPGAPQRA